MLKALEHSRIKLRAIFINERRRTWVGVKGLDYEPGKMDAHHLTLAREEERANSPHNSSI